MNPIFYTAAQVALMVKFAAFLDPGFGAKCDLSRVQVRLTVAGRMKPRAEVLHAFDLEQVGKEYRWDPRRESKGGN